MSKKGTITGAEKVIDTFGQSAQAKKMQPPISKEEKAKREAQGNTQGRQGAKKPRINLALTTDNYNFVRRFSKCRGQSQIDFINSIIENYKQEHIKELEKIEELIKTL